ncbi:MAG: S-methyl-5-thioribose-1-phosphate isomerase [Chloroflexota bacterium]|nr:MAG: S-methyl-5-thioribose-1-phosphate isomerase [Chloroflexota bacterium]
MRTVEWDNTHQQVRMIDQRLLPGEYREVSFESCTQVAEAIQRMVVRGAPAIGAAAAFGMALAAQTSPAGNSDELRADLVAAAGILQAARPTAFNLSWAVQRMLLESEGPAREDVNQLRASLLDLAQRIADDDVQINRQMATHGAGLMNAGETVIHHCNTGALATVDWGTALGVIRMAHEQGKRPHVLVDETRPRLQGSRLTAWELDQYGISYEIITDNAAGFFLSRGEVDRVFVGADRVAANGDVANKIGTYMLALAARDNQVPFFAVVPTSTVDLSVAEGAQIPIEERDPSEVLQIEAQGAPIAPAGAAARNPAFDITPHRLITGIVTENGVVYPPFELNLRQAVMESPS